MFSILSIAGYPAAFELEVIASSQIQKAVSRTRYIDVEVVTMPAPAFSNADVAAKLREIKRKYLSLTDEQDFLIVSELARGREIHTDKKGEA